MGLGSLAWWDCRFESHRVYGCLSVVNIVGGQRSVQRADPSSRGVLPSVVVCLSVIPRPRQGSAWLVRNTLGKIIYYTVYSLTGLDIFQWLPCAQYGRQGVLYNITITTNCDKSYDRSGLNYVIIRYKSRMQRAERALVYFQSCVFHMNPQIFFVLCPVPRSHSQWNCLV